MWAPLNVTHVASRQHLKHAPSGVECALVYRLLFCAMVRKFVSSKSELLPHMEAIFTEANVLSSSPMTLPQAGTPHTWPSHCKKVRAAFSGGHFFGLVDAIVRNRVTNRSPPPQNGPTIHPTHCPHPPECPGAVPCWADLRMIPGGERRGPVRRSVMRSSQLVVENLSL